MTYQFGTMSFRQQSGDGTTYFLLSAIARTVAEKEKDKIDGKSFRDMELLITISQRMSGLLDDLLDDARLREKRIVLQQKPVLVQAVVPGVISMPQFMMEGKAIRMETDIPDSLPPVMADEKRLIQILHNLLHNALKYTAEGFITVSAEKRDGRLLIQVSDTGMGMDAETRTKVFLPYEQGPEGAGDGKGIGLGLSICKQLVELHGGALTVCSEQDKGSVFSFDLPLAGTTASSPPQKEEPGVSPEVMGNAEPFFLHALAGNVAAAVSLPPHWHNGRAHILAVDDDPVNLSVLAGILSTEPYSVTTVGSAREALKLLEIRQWDLLIADVMMPFMSGYELTKRVRELYSVSELPVLLLTARSQPADIYTGFVSGANDYVTKPVDALELRYRISALIRLKQSVNERLRMEAAYLQAQIHPHFLFNTLNSIMALSELDTAKMQQLVYSFATYLRVSFDFMNTGELVELSHELELVKAYLYIEKERFENTLTVVWEVEPHLNPPLPPLTLQPLVENAIKHGIFSRSRGGTLYIRISRQNNAVRFEIRDDGKGMDQGKIDQLLEPARKGTGGIGIFNTNRRLIQLYGQGLSIVSRPNEGTTVSFSIPDD
jgi:two-component system, sensor histidine kinase ChiS